MALVPPVKLPFQGFGTSYIPGYCYEIRRPPGAFPTHSQKNDTSIILKLTLILLKYILLPMPADPTSWFLELEDEDQQFVKRLVLASGSLKELAERYDVSYPTIRLRLDRLIERIRTSEDPLSDAFETKVRQLVAEGDVSARIGKQLLRVHKETKKGESK